MTAIAKLMSLAFPDSSDDAEMLKSIAIFCGGGLLISLWMTNIEFGLAAGLF